MRKRQAAERAEEDARGIKSKRRRRTCCKRRNHSPTVVKKKQALRVERCEMETEPGRGRGDDEERGGAKEKMMTEKERSDERGG